MGSPGLGTPAMTLAGGIPANTFPPGRSSAPELLPFFRSGTRPFPRGVGLLDPNAGRPPRQNQWSIGIQREITKDIAVEASYVGNRGVWWQAPSLEDINAVTPSILSAHDMNLSDPQFRRCFPPRWAA